MKSLRYQRILLRIWDLYIYIANLKHMSAIHVHNNHMVHIPKLIIIHYQLTHSWMEGYPIRDCFCCRRTSTAPWHLQ